MAKKTETKPASEWVSLDWIGQWLDYLEVNNLAKGTLPVYRCALTRFRLFLVTDGRNMSLIGKEGPITLDSYRAWLNRQKGRRKKVGLDSSTVHLYLRGLSNYFEWLMYRDRWQWGNPVKRSKLPKLDADHRDLISMGEAQRLFDACDRLAYPHPFDPLMAKSAIALMLGCGLRASEARNLPVNDLRFGSMDVYLREQKNDELSLQAIPQAFLPVHEAWYWRRHDWIQEAKEAGWETPDTWLLLDPRRSIGREGINTMIRRLIHLAELPLHGVTSHAFRHLFVTTVSKMSDLRTAQDAARHATLNTTARYVHPSRDDVRQAVDLTAAAFFKRYWLPVQLVLPFANEYVERRQYAPAR